MEIFLAQCCHTLPADPLHLVHGIDLLSETNFTNHLARKRQFRAKTNKPPHGPDAPRLRRFKNRNKKNKNIFERSAMKFTIWTAELGLFDAFGSDFKTETRPKTLKNRKLLICENPHSTSPMCSTLAPPTLFQMDFLERIECSQACAWYRTRATHTTSAKTKC